MSASSSTGFDIDALKQVARAPSMTRWSAVSGQRQGRAGTKALPSQTGFMADLIDPRMATSGAFHNRRKVGAADAAQAGDG